MPYVVRTDALHAPLYFAGALEGFFKPSIVLTEIIMNAWVFQTREEAEKLRSEELGDAWSITEVSFGASGNLKKPGKSRPTFENDLEIVAEAEYSGGWLMDTMGGRRADYARIKAMKGHGVYDELAKASASEGHARRSWTMAFGTKREQKEYAALDATVSTSPAHLDQHGQGGEG